MKKISFKVISQKEISVIPLIKELNNISCRICFDIENGYVTVENINTTMIDSVIELISNYYTILGIDIDNTFESSAVHTNSSGIKEELQETSQKRPTVLEPQTEDDLIIKKVEFENKYVENRINNFLKTAYWAMYNKRATEKDIGDHILTCMDEISMRYSSTPILKFSVGDIVDVYYGTHLPGEIMGRYVHAIVCNILSKDMAFVVPITKSNLDISAHNYLPLVAPQDATYENGLYKGGTVLLDKGKYIRIERFNSIKGRIQPEFFEKLLHKLISTFDFTEHLNPKFDDANTINSTNDETTNKILETPIPTDSSTINVDEPSNLTKESNTKTDSPSASLEEPNTEAVSSYSLTEDLNSETNSPSTSSNTSSQKVVKTKRIGVEESCLLEILGDAFDKLDSSKNVEEQIESFLTRIGMSTTEHMVNQAFIISCDIKKINYENILFHLHFMNPSVKEETIKTILKETFNNWLEKYPTLAKKCPRISLISILKVFAKKFS